ncbi:unannotated protein [freshwater metagenome]|uniref:Unannotated protein n=1 Tax=freshwater metagenome TaxID=449393 RepID=A0A6J6TNV2_9ZZZZ|nr:hypothetical protein [Actinomycetota bacterium]
MKRKIFSALLATGLFILPSTAFAEGNEKNEPEHSIEGAHEGFEVGELLAAGGGIAIALGIAFTVGRRSRKKD